MPSSAIAPQPSREKVPLVAGSVVGMLFASAYVARRSAGCGTRPDVKAVSDMTDGSGEVEPTCPKCGAEPGQPCLGVSGKPRKSWHEQRHLAVRRSGPPHGFGGRWDIDGVWEFEVAPGLVVFTPQGTQLGRLAAVVIDFDWEPGGEETSKEGGERIVEIEERLLRNERPHREGGLGGGIEAGDAGQANVNGAGEGRVSEPRRDLPAEVWAVYVEEMGPRKKELLPQERAVIRDALKVATVEECKDAIRGCKSSAFHMGENDHHRKYNRLTQILKGKRGGKTTREQIDMMCGYLADGSQIPSEATAEIYRAKERVRLGMTHPTIEYHRKNGEEAQTFLRSYGIEAEAREYEVAPGVVGLRVVFSGPATS